MNVLPAKHFPNQPNGSDIERYPGYGENRILTRVADQVRQVDAGIKRFSGGQTEREKREFQEEVSNLLNVLHLVENQAIIAEQTIPFSPSRQKQLENSLDRLQIALDGLLQEQPNITLSRQIRRHVEYSIYATDQSLKGSLRNAALKVIHLSSAPTKVLCGLVLTLPLYLGAIAVSANHLTLPPAFAPATVVPSDPNTVFPVAAPESQLNLTSLLVLVGSAGALGSVISMLTRLETYRDDDQADSLLPIYIGLLKPLIGAAFGILLCTISFSAISPLQDATKKMEPSTIAFTFFSLSFLIGFSERLAKDAVSQLEERRQLEDSR